MKNYSLDELNALVNKYTKARENKVIELFQAGQFPLLTDEEADMVVNGQFGKASRRYRDRNNLALYQAEIIIGLVRKAK